MLELGLDPVRTDLEWTLVDVLDANEALDMQLDVDEMRAAVRKARRDAQDAVDEQLRNIR